MEQPPSTPPTPLTSAANTPNTASSAESTAPQTSRTSSPNNGATLSRSEPSLRFPKPLGNRQLASWVLSSSNPDINTTPHTESNTMGGSAYATERMAASTPPIFAGEDTGDDSSYDMVSCTDTESQDGDYNESMGESLGSLDFHRPDDVHSLAENEETGDEDEEDEEEESVVDSSELTARAAERPHFNLRNDNEKHSLHQESSNVDDDARSQSSLDYTSQSLRTPSLLTPEASHILEPQTPHQARVHLLRQGLTQSKKWFANMCSQFRSLRRPTLQAVVISLPLLLCVMAPALIPWIYTPFQGANENKLAVTTPAITLSSAGFFTASKPSSTAVAVASGGADLIPVDEAITADWLFGNKIRPDVSFAARAPKAVVVHVPSSVKRTWLTKDCIVVVTTRDDGNHVVTDWSSIDEGILLRFPAQETHGMLTVDFSTTCRPKVRRVVKVHFGKGVMEEALEMTKNLAHDLGEFVPAAAQEAERRFEGAKRSLGCASHNFGLSVQSASHNLYKTIDSTWSGAQRSLAIAKNKAEDTASDLAVVAQKAKEQLPKAKDIQDNLHLGLLESQISAKLWWLKVTGRSEEYDAYKEKATAFLATMRVYTGARKKKVEEASSSSSSSWPYKIPTLLSDAWKANEKR
ncbi:hypothetical protein S7711_08797 [Stachybotrys chartarum IBT 7711]|uniref:Uncharacterized protein n=1 Tax=Stachybotrys chartarum (strain CBS 109288 / IBT 7711) TaxID=1280523 RepID=A0A084AJY1_STACB|nr:hypothetical protein S7711_08797 [Stachybotrys chartarum IBT 7711]